MDIYIYIYVYYAKYVIYLYEDGGGEGKVDTIFIWAADYIP